MSDRHDALGIWLACGDNPRGVFILEGSSEMTACRRMAAELGVPIEQVGNAAMANLFRLFGEEKAAGILKAAMEAGLAEAETH